MMHVPRYIVPRTNVACCNCARQPLSLIGSMSVPATTRRTGWGWENSRRPSMCFCVNTGLFSTHTMLKDHSLSLVIGHQTNSTHTLEYNVHQPNVPKLALSQTTPLNYRCATRLWINLVTTQSQRFLPQFIPFQFLTFLNSWQKLQLLYHSNLVDRLLVLLQHTNCQLKCKCHYKPSLTPPNLKEFRVQTLPP